MQVNNNKKGGDTVKDGALVVIAHPASILSRAERIPYCFRFPFFFHVDDRLILPTSSSRKQKRETQKEKKNSSNNNDNNINSNNNINNNNK